MRVYTDLTSVFTGWGRAGVRIQFAGGRTSVGLPNNYQVYMAGVRDDSA